MNFAYLLFVGATFLVLVEPDGQAAGIISNFIAAVNA